ncbi:MAG TPA: hypothetical protein VEL82_06875 [Thermoplasmata archaeon]|nr:hypothetical protein [Thermoplasmata archaeon]
MSRGAAVLLLSVLALLCLPSGAASGVGGHYLPRAGDALHYSESVTVGRGTGSYSGYTEASYYNGSIAVMSVAPNGTANATYASAGTYENNQGVEYPWSEHGTFSFSAVTFHYLNGTDNQSGYVDPFVWFYLNNSLGDGATLELLNSPMQVVSTDVPFPYSGSSTGYVATIFTEGNGTYERDDAYGQFTAVYNWKEYFDPGTGYVVAYVYREADSDAAGDGFTYTDTLTDTETTFALTPAPAPPAASSPPPVPWLLVIVGIVVVVIVVGGIVIALSRRRSARANLPRHPTTPMPGTMPAYAPPPVHLIPGDQPAVQQVVIRETVKVPCRYCGTLMDSTATVCPRCGAPRT